MKITSPDGNTIPKVTVALTVGEAQWFLDMLEGHIEDMSASEDGVIKLAFYTNSDDSDDSDD